MTITELKFNRTGLNWLLLFIATVLLVAVLIAVGSGAIRVSSGPRLMCFIGEELVFSQRVDAATQSGDGSEATITITLAGQTRAIIPPQGGKCYIAR